MTANREYKDSVFSLYLSDPERLIDVYNAVAKTNYPPDTPVEINTLTDVLYKNQVKRDLAPANKVGVIDSDYRGEIFVMLHNHGKEVRTVEPGERVAQLVIVPVYTPGFIQVDSLSDTVRGEGGFGSTGR